MALKTIYRQKSYNFKLMHRVVLLSTLMKLKALDHSITFEGKSFGMYLYLDDVGVRFQYPNKKEYVSIVRTINGLYAFAP